MKRFALILTTLVVQVVVGDDLFWTKNSNWNNPSNWGLDRLPCSGEVASFASVPDNSVIFLNTNSTVMSVVLPANGKIVLGSSITIRFSEDKDSECQIPGDTPPMAAPVQNEFTGARNQYWELPQNWATKDGSPAKRTPCGDDNAIFPQNSAFSFVSANSSITVRSLSVRGVSLKSLQDLEGTGPKEFLADIQIDPNCAQDPSRCPCMKSPTTGNLNDGGSSNVAGIVVGVLVLILVIIAVVVVVVILAVYFFMKHTRGRGFGYAKDELNEAQGQEEQKESDTSNVEMKPFDNPIYDSAVINPSDVQPIGYETKPNLEGELSDIPIDTEPTLHTYEPVTEMLKPPIDVDTQKEPYGDVVEPEPKPEKEVTPVLGKYQRL